MDQPPTDYFADFTVTAGNHTVKVEYFDSSNAGTLTIDIIDLASIPQGWQAEYFPNIDLSGAPMVTRNDGETIDRRVRQQTLRRRGEAIPARSSET